ncbi:MAG: T9SS type A sorting domain-containing protein [Bacteroidetes bacterium]|nr:T9SS type A sorting domain-containing protein [Bacteroidota bacterium]
MKIVLLPILLTFFCLNAFGQSTWEKVYDIFQTIGTIDSVDFSDSIQTVYNQIFEQPPANPFAQSKGYKRINPGHPHRSFLVRKINNGLDADIVLDPAEGGNAGMLADKDKELVRQWILYGAPETGEVADTALINQYYNGNGIASMPIPPAAPDPIEGFQIHFGPFFVAPSQETEYHLKYETQLADTIEINRVDILMGDFSHHFILNRFLDGQEGNVPDGFRSNGAHLSTEGITAAQFSDTLLLPNGTAFQLFQNDFLDLNSHYINFTPDKVLASEVYINIYTQPKGWAEQIMQTAGIPGALFDLPFLCIPNDSSTYTFDTDYIPNSDMFVWSLGSHTHQWGIDFDIYKRNTDGSRGEHYFDASYRNGDTNDIFIGYKYDEPPTRTYNYPFLFVPQNEGLIQEASYINTGPNNPVCWGLTSEDEMMIMGLMYVMDTTGLANAEPYVPPTGIENSALEAQAIKVYPNPFTGSATFILPKNEQGNFIITLYNVFGEEVKQIGNIKSEKITLQRGDLPSGVYFYQVTTNNKLAGKGKVIIY